METTASASIWYRLLPSWRESEGLMQLRTAIQGASYDSANTVHTDCARMTFAPTARMNVDFPVMFAPVRMTPSIGPSVSVFGTQPVTSGCSMPARRAGKPAPTNSGRTHRLPALTDAIAIAASSRPRTSAISRRSC